ncbi:MAG: DUF3307 domain-containing protein [Paracoccaceae bacterium]
MTQCAGGRRHIGPDKACELRYLLRRARRFASPVGTPRESAMTAETESILWLLVLLQIKHAVADFCLLTPYMLANRMRYGHPGGLAHVGVHLIGTALALTILRTPLPLTAALLIAEGLFHYHVDFAKARWVKRSGVTPKDALYWYAFGADQALHQLSYLAMAAWWAVA